MTTTDVRSGAIEALAGRIFSTGVGAAELCTAYLGIHLGLYRSLAESPATPAALAERTGCDERYVREWLTAQAVAGLLTAFRRAASAPTRSRSGLSSARQPCSTSPAGGLRRWADPADRAPGLAVLPAGPVTSLDGRVTIVTGTSSGLGRRFAEVLDGAGARVVLASRRHQEDLELAARLRDALPVACDVRSPADREALVQAATSRFGQIDILVNNAGVAYAGPAEEESPEHVQDLIDTNLSAVFGLSQLAGRHMLARGSGVIVNIASPSATVSLDRYGLAGYGATKAGVVALTRELAYQWGGASLHQVGGGHGHDVVGYVVIL